jgi:hypothetical protein
MALLSNKTLFPYFFRIPPSDNKQSLALASLFPECEWARVGVLYFSDPYSSGLALQFSEDLQRYRNITSHNFIMINTGEEQSQLSFRATVDGTLLMSVHVHNL